MDERLKKLDYLFNPRSIAFIGATETRGKWGFIIYNNLLAGGYEGEIYPVNPGRETVLGKKAYPSARAIPGEVDLAVFTVPASGVGQALDDCLAKGVKAGVVISAGFKELGGEHADQEARLAARARSGGMALVGPNGQGVCCPASKLYPWIPPSFRPPHGPVGVVSQSGNIQTLLIAELVAAGLGVSKSASSGNEADLRTEDYLEYLASDPDTEVVLAYLEGILDGRQFIKRARAAAARKPIVVVKGGATSSGVAAALSHTGALAVSDELFDAACKKTGIIRAGRIDEASVIAGSFINRPLPRGPRVAIVTGGGGFGVIAADVCVKLGLEVPELSSRTLAQIGELMPEWWVPGNPVDLVAGLRFGVRRPIMEVLMKSGEIDSLMLIRIGPPPAMITTQADGQGLDSSKFIAGMIKRQVDLARETHDLMRQRQVPVYMVSNLFTDATATAALADKRMTIYQSIDSAGAAIKAMTDYGKWRQG